MKHDIDPAAFWASLSPAEAYALLRAAPKVAGPWERTPHGTWHRDGIKPCPITAAITNRDVATEPNVATVRDADLRAAGWLLVDEEAP